VDGDDDELLDYVDVLSQSSSGPDSEFARKVGHHFLDTEDNIEFDMFSGVRFHSGLMCYVLLYKYRRGELTEAEVEYTMSGTFEQLLGWCRWMVIPTFIARAARQRHEIPVRRLWYLNR
jgi:hypothetical protein